MEVSNLIGILLDFEKKNLSAKWKYETKALGYEIVNERIRFPY
jgi:hypothetical protein